jgi:hypothetical protein
MEVDGPDDAEEIPPREPVDPHDKDFVGPQAVLAKQGKPQTGRKEEDPRQHDARNEVESVRSLSLGARLVPDGGGAVPANADLVQHSGGCVFHRGEAVSGAQTERAASDRRGPAGNEVTT